MGSVGCEWEEKVYWRRDRGEGGIGEGGIGGGGGAVEERGEEGRRGVLGRGGRKVGQLPSKEEVVWEESAWPVAGCRRGRPSTGCESRSLNRSS